LDPNSTSVGDGGPALQARLLYPIGVAANSEGNLYIADEGLLRIRKVTPDGLITTIAGTGEFSSAPDGSMAAASPVWPTAVAVGASGTVYFSDSHTRVRKIAADGTLVTVAGAQAGTLAPSGIAIDRAGNLYIAEQRSYRVWKLTTDGAMTTIAGTGVKGNTGEGGPATSAQLMGPANLAVDAAGNLYIADGNEGNRILKVTPGGTLTRVAGGGDVPKDAVPATSSYVSTFGGIAVDAEGNIYSADWYRNVVRKITADGIIHTIAGTGRQGGTDGCGTALAAEFYAPEALAVGPAGRLYVGERGNPWVREINGASIRTVAGPGPSRFSGDGGPANSAAIDTPAGLAFDFDGNLYLADSGNNRIRKISLSGIITTLPGLDAPVAGDYSGCAQPAGTLNHPRAVAAARNGLLYIADTGNNRVMTFDNSGELTTFVGAGAGLNAPSGLAVDRDGNVFIADTENNRVLGANPDGTVASVGPRFLGPTGLAFDESGNLYIAESKAFRVSRMTPDGVVSHYAGTGFNTVTPAPVPHAPNELDDPAAVAVDTFGSVYIADLAGALQRVTRNCAISNPYYGAVSGVAVDPQGNVYFSDTRNNAVWKLPAAPPSGAEDASPTLGYSALVNAASLLPHDAHFLSPLLPYGLTYGAVPGEMVRIRGACLGPFEKVTGQYDASMKLPTELGGVSVLFDDAPASLISAQAGEIWAVVPSSVASKSTANVAVRFDGGSAQTTAKVVSVEPGIFIEGGSGSGQAIATNEDGTPNAESNPAARGSRLTFWATGQGATNPSFADGQAAPADPLLVPAQPVAITIGGRAADAVAALAPRFVGLLQVTATVPPDAQTGIVRLTLSVGGISNVVSSSPYISGQTATIAVK
jgi:uncharacterized protein (TIGR03437 family)